MVYGEFNIYHGKTSLDCFSSRVSKRRAPSAFVDEIEVQGEVSTASVHVASHGHNGLLLMFMCTFSCAAFKSNIHAMSKLKNTYNHNSNNNNHSTPSATFAPHNHSSLSVTLMTLFSFVLRLVSSVSLCSFGTLNGIKINQYVRLHQPSSVSAQQGG